MRKLVIGALTTSVLVVMGGLRVVDLQRSRADTLQAADERAGSLALVLSGYVAETFAAGDAALRQLALHSRRVGGPSAPAHEWGPSLESARAGLTTIGAISVVDRHGVIRHSTRGDIIGQSRRDVPLVDGTAGDTSDQLVVGSPFESPVIARAFPLGRRITTAGGEVDGQVVASFMPANMRAFFQRVNVGERGVLWLFHASGVVVLREPSLDNPIGESASGNPIFQAAATGGPHGSLRGPVRPDGPEMLSAFRVTRSRPLIVAVSLDRGEVLTAWRREALGSAVAFGVASLLLTATLFVLYRQIDQRAVAESALAETRQREAESLRRANDQLAATVAREQSARREAETASALKDQFVMTVSHELRTPLTAIAGWAGLLVDGLVDESRKEGALRTIQRNAQAQTRLIDDLLDVSGIMTGKMRLDMRRVEFTAIVRNALEAVSPAIDAKGITLDARFDDGVGAVNGDAGRLQQVVWNLLSNAAKFTAGGGRVEVAVSQIAEEIVITVSDTGIGISPDFLPHVFERFRQQNATPSRRHGGLGLGLAIVRSLVALHGGSVTAHSAGDGQGATFTVRLPAAPVSV